MSTDVPMFLKNKYLKLLEFRHLITHGLFSSVKKYVTIPENDEFESAFYFPFANIKLRECWCLPKPLFELPLHFDYCEVCKRDAKIGFELVMFVYGYFLTVPNSNLYQSVFSRNIS